MALSLNSRQTTGLINAYLRKHVEPGIKGNFLLAMMRKKGRMKMRDLEFIGKTIQWWVRMRRNTPTTTSDMVPRDFKIMDRHLTANLDWVAWDMAEYWTKFEKLISTNPDTAYVNVIKNLLKWMVSDFNDWLPEQLYKDGIADTDNLSGLDTLSEADTSLSLITNSKCGAVSQAYGGITASLGNKGGTWTPPSGDGWPVGTGPLRHYFWHRMVVDAQYASWSGDTMEWPFTWRQCLRFTDTYQDNLHGAPSDAWVMAPEWYREVKDSQDDKERIEVTREPDILALGFKTISFDGTPIYSDYACPANSCNGIKWDKMTLHSLQKQMIATEDDWDIDFASKKLVADCYMQMRFESPIYFPKIAIIT